MKKINKDDLMEGYSIYGNKGAVYSDECHILYKDNLLCGNTGLARNWAVMLKHLTIGCEKCIDVYTTESRDMKLKELGI